MLPLPTFHVKQEVKDLKDLRAEAEVYEWGGARGLAKTLITPASTLKLTLYRRSRLISILGGGRKVCIPAAVLFRFCPQRA